MRRRGFPLLWRAACAAERAAGGPAALAGAAGSGLLAAPPAAAPACSLAALLPLPPPAAAAAWTRPFSSSVADAGAADPQQQHGEHQQQQQQRRRERHDVPLRPSRRRVTQPPPPGSPLAHLMACDSIDDMRAWRQGLAAEGAFGAPELGFAIRVLITKEGLAPQERAAYLRELLAAAAEGQVALDGKAAAYLLWGPAKLELPAADPDVQRVLPLACQHLDSMQSNDVASVLWALGVMRLPLSEEQAAGLLQRFEALLPEMKMKHMTAAALGITRQNLDAFAQPLVQAFEAKLHASSSLALPEASRLVKLVPYMPGLPASSILAQAVFDEIVQQANRLSLFVLAESTWAAAKLGYSFGEGQLERVLGCIQDKLGQNRGTQVQSLLHGLDAMGFKAGEGPVSDEFVAACVEAQVAHLRGKGGRNQAHVNKFLRTLGNLRASRVPAELLQQMLEELQAGGLEQLRTPWHTQMAFRRLGFQPGVEALEALTEHGQRRERQRQGLEAAAPTEASHSQ